TPAGITGQDWRRLRARHLAVSYGVDQREAENGLLVQEERLAGFPAHDEVILWFEHDLFCQTNLIYLLNWFAERNLGKTKLSLICIGEFPG
ncbi:MAG: RNA polymerase subunit sigma, partial [Pyrinomonadaceae bacterium]